jgi:hypothetical protein
VGVSVARSLKQPTGSLKGHLGHCWITRLWEQGLLALPLINGSFVYLSFTLHTVRTSNGAPRAKRWSCSLRCHCGSLQEVLLGQQPGAHCTSLLQILSAFKCCFFTSFISVCLPASAAARDLRCPWAIPHPLPLILTLSPGRLHEGPIYPSPACQLSVGCGCLGALWAACQL